MRCICTEGGTYKLRDCHDDPALNSFTTCASSMRKQRRCSGTPEGCGVLVLLISTVNGVAATFISSYAPITAQDSKSAECETVQQ
jgi:hypothetical protein